MRTEEEEEEEEEAWGARISLGQQLVECSLGMRLEGQKEEEKRNIFTIF